MCGGKSYLLDPFAVRVKQVWLAISQLNEPARVFAGMEVHLTGLRICHDYVLRVDVVRRGAGFKIRFGRFGDYFSIKLYFSPNTVNALFEREPGPGFEFSVSGEEVC